VVRKSRRLWTLSRLMHTFLDTKHLSPTWLADAASFRGRWVSNLQRLSTII